MAENKIMFFSSAMQLIKCHCHSKDIITDSICSYIVEAILS